MPAPVTAPASRAFDFRNMRASHRPAYRGRIPTYRQTQGQNCPRFKMDLAS